MKNLILPVLVLLTFQVIAQSFEGKIRWSMKMEITDPKRKAQMEEAQKKMNDPANQAKMKEMQAKMNDPQFKAMMENNPQMKAQMEQAMKAMQSGSMMPTGIDVRIKGLNTLTKMEGGMMAGELLYLHDKDQSYMLDRQNKTYSPMPHAGDKMANATSDVKVTKTGETAKILGYNCTKYVVEAMANGKPMTQSLWATTEIQGIDMKALSKGRWGKDQMYFDKIDGVPLKMEIKTSEGIMTMEATEFKKESQNAADFQIPSEFKETPFMGGMPRQ
jgi:hypothetical protein